MIKQTKLNNVKVVPINIPSMSIDNVKGGKFFETLYCNVGIIAKKNSGKSSIIANIIDNCSGKNTNIFIFSSTVNKDPTYKEIIKRLDKKKINHHEWTSIKDEEGNHLQAIIDEIKQKEDDENELELQPPIVIEKPRCWFGGLSESERIKREQLKKEKEEELAKKREDAKLKKSKRKIAPEYIFVMDDLGAEGLRNKTVATLLKINRHLKSKVIIACHSLTDMVPSARKQLDYAMISRSFNEEKLETLYKDLDISIDYDKFYKLYKFATEKPYSFLYIDTRREKFREGFSNELTIE